MREELMTYVAGSSVCLEILEPLLALPKVSKEVDYTVSFGLILRLWIRQLTVVIQKVNLRHSRLPLHIRPLQYFPLPRL